MNNEEGEINNKNISNNVEEEEDLNRNRNNSHDHHPHQLVNNNKGKEKQQGEDVEVEEYDPLRFTLSLSTYPASSKNRLPQQPPPPSPPLLQEQDLLSPPLLQEQYLLSAPQYPLPIHHPLSTPQPQPLFQLLRDLLSPPPPSPLPEYEDLLSTPSPLPQYQDLLSPPQHRLPPPPSPPLLQKQDLLSPPPPLSPPLLQEQDLLSPPQHPLPIHHPLSIPQPQPLLQLLRDLLSPPPPSPLPEYQDLLSTPSPLPQYQDLLSPPQHRLQLSPTTLLYLPPPPISLQQYLPSLPDPTPLPPMVSTDPSSSSAFRVPRPRPFRARKNLIQPGKTETVPAPFLWATNIRAEVHTLEHLESEQLTSISGEVQCKSCKKTYSITFNLHEKFMEIGSFIVKNKNKMLDRAPIDWMAPNLLTCESCGQEKSVKPVIPDCKKSINWLFLLLGKMLGFCTLKQLKYFCKHSGYRQTGAKVRILYLTYLGLCKQLDPNGPFDR